MIARSLKVAGPLLAVAVATLTSTTALAQPAAAPAAAAAESTVSPAIQGVRRVMLDKDVSTLTFRNMDQLFTTRTVPHAGQAWNLPRADRPLDFTYSFKGVSHTPEQFLDRTYTNALLIIKDGRIVSEIYRNNMTAGTRHIGWSMTKSITSILVGCALAEGRIKSLDDQVASYLPELRGGGYDGVTVRQVLQMRSGVDYEERYDFANPGIAARNHDAALVRNVARFADAARTVRRAHKPGEVFQYKTLDTAVLGWLLERVSGGSTLSAYAAQRLWEPLGAEADGYFIMDGPPGVGREFNGAGFNAVLRDYGRIGLMMLNGGRAGDRQIVSREWVAESTRPAAVEDANGGYGYQWWTMPGSDAYAAVGLQGQFIYVDPATRTVIVKLSYFPPGEVEADEESRAFFAAASAWPAR
jgi:hypothetical protein